PVNVAAADSNRTQFHQNFVRFRIRRQRHLSHFERALSDELDGFQSTTLADCLPAPSATVTTTAAAVATATAPKTTAATVPATTVVSAAPIVSTVSAAVSAPIVSAAPISIRRIAVCVRIIVGIIVITGIR